MDNGDQRLSPSSAALCGVAVGAVWGMVEALLLKIRIHTIPGSGDPWLLQEAILLYALSGFFIGLILRWLLPRKTPAQSAFTGPLIAYLLLWALYKLHRDLLPQNAVSLIGILATLATLAIGGSVFWFATKLVSRMVPVSSWRRILWVTLPMTALVAAGGLLQTKRIQHAAPNPELKNKPNIILITADTTRADHLSPYGYSRDTSPNLSKVAASGEVFDQAYAVASWTLPSHASLFTGNLPSKHGASYTYLWLDSSQLTLAEILKSHGYRTAGFAGGPLLSATFNMAQGFDYYSDCLDFAAGIQNLVLIRVLKRVLHLSLWWADGQRDGTELTDSVLSWLKNQDRDTRFFLFINYFDPHDPYHPPPGYDRFSDPTYHGQMNGRVISLRANRETGERSVFENGRYIPLNNDDYRKLIALYDGEILYMDHNMGRLFDYLKASGLADNTLLIITADHGETIGEHKLLDHGHTLYQEQIRIPLILAGPGIPPGKRAPGVIRNIDVLPTLMEFLGWPVPGPVQGVSFVNYLQGGDDNRQILSEINEDPATRVRTFRRRLIAVGNPMWKYLWSSTGGNELYHLPEDPGETTNLFGEQRPEAVDLKTRVMDYVRRFPESNQRRLTPIDDSTLESLKANSYIN